MPEKPLPIGEHGRNVAANVERLRKARRLSLRELSGRLAEYGRPIGPTVLNRQAQGGRRADADDLMAFAAVLGVTPAELLAAPGSGPAAEHPALDAAGVLAGRIAELLTAGDDEAGAIGASVDRALRRAALEVEELLAEAQRKARPPEDAARVVRPPRNYAA